MTGPTAKSAEDADAMLAAASAWFVRLRSEDAGPALWDDFCAWRDGSPAHTAAFEEVSALWNALGDVADHPAMTRLRIEALSVAPAHTAGWRRHAWPIAASLLLAIIPAAMLLQWAAPRNGPAAPPVAQAPANAPPTALAPQLAAAASDPSALAAARFSSRYRTAVGQRASFVLPDRSRIELNTNSLVAVDFSAGRRSLRLLQGEAVFNVARDPARPFVVAAGTERVVALGTIFSVRKDAGGIKVMLLEGKIRVERGDGAAATRIAQLVAGEQIVVGAGQPAEISRANMSRAASWRDGRLIFDSQPLSDVVAEINRYSDTKLQVGDPSIASLRISATLRIGSADNFANALAAGFPVRLVRQRGDAILILPDARDRSGDAGPPPSL